MAGAEILNNSFTLEEREIIRNHKTPQEIQEWLNTLAYNFEKQGETLQSFRRVVRSRTAHCLEGALAAAAIMRQNGRSAQLLCMEARDIDHNMCVYRGPNGRWGSVAQSRDPNLKGKPPEYETLRDLAMAYHPYYYHYFTGDRSDLTLRGYALLSLDRLRRDWMTASEEMWDIQNLLYKPLYIALFPNGDSHRVFKSNRDGSITWVN